MSWNTYVSDQLIATGGVKQGAILGLDGSTWAASDGFTISPAEGQFVANAFKDPTPARASGIKLCTIKYFVLGADESTINGKKGTSGICLVKTTQAIIVGRYEEPTPPGMCNDACGKLADYLKSTGY